MANESAESAHARDLGYLERFIQKLEGQAQALPAGPRQQALSLLDGQRGQWATIMGLLSGESLTASQAPGPTDATAPHGPAPAVVPAAPTSSAATRTPGGGGLTVGSLIGHP
jgi:hypothetical protein